MAHTHLAHALLALAGSKSASAVAKQAAISPSTLSKLISTDRRIDEDTLRKLCSMLPNPKAGLELLFAHLRDEVDRAGRLQTEINITADEATYDDDIRLLATESPNDGDLRAILHDLAQLVRNARAKLAAYEQRELPLQAVADPKPDEKINPPAPRTKAQAKADEAKERRRISRELRKAQREKDAAAARSTPPALKQPAPE